MFSDPEHNIEQLDLQSGSVVADFGAGSGFYALAAARAVGDRGRVYAVDVQKDLLHKLKNEALRRNILNLEVIWGDVEKEEGTKLRTHSVDAAIVANLLFQLHHKETFVKELSRVLKPKGKVLVVDWQSSYGGMGPADDNIITKTEAEKLFQKEGFSFEKEIKAGEHHWGLRFHKE